MKATRSSKAALKLRPEDMRIFIAIGSSPTLTHAAEELKMPLFTVSRALKRIEATAQIVLIRRDSTGLRLTEVGEEYMHACHSVLEAHQTAINVLLARKTEPEGILHVSAPITFVQAVLSQILPNFLTSFPKVRVETSLFTENNQEPKSPHDIFLRGGMPSESRYRLKLFPSIRQGLYASPAYLAAHSEPKHPFDLEQHDCITDAYHRSPWNLTRPNEQAPAQIVPRITLADPASMARLAVRSSGIAILPRWLAQEYVSTAALIHVLPDWEPNPIVFCALYTGQLAPSSKESAFLNLLASILGGPKDPRCHGHDPKDFFVYSSATGAALAGQVQGNTVPAKPARLIDPTMN